MKNIVANVPSLREPIQRCPGFSKKLLADHKLDLLTLCGFGCRYCSSISGSYLRINQRRFADMTEAQIGERILPSENPHLSLECPDVLDRLDEQLDKKSHDWGAGQTVVFSMLTDAFSPNLVEDGTTEEALRMVLDQTAFRVRILTKNAIVGSEPWLSMFAENRNRVVVGLSTGNSDDHWAIHMEVNTSLPTERLTALNALQEAGVPTFGMLCPLFPDMLEDNRLEDLVDKIDPGSVEHMWGEPFNDRINWRVVRAGNRFGSSTHRWFTDVYEKGNKAAWSSYATELFVRLRDKARAEGWVGKLRFLLYENDITEHDAAEFRTFEGVLLQSKPQPDGFSRNPHIARYQKSMSCTAVHPPLWQDQHLKDQRWDESRWEEGFLPNQPIRPR